MDTSQAKSAQGPSGCVYCGKVGPLTDDHVPPQCIFGKPKPPDLIEVPACRECNQGWSKEDEYFRLMLCLREDVADQEGVRRSAIPAIMRSLEKPKKVGFRKSLLSSMGQAHLLTPTGLYLGKRPTYDVDLGRINRVAARITRGLFLHESKRHLDPGWVAVAWQSDSIAEQHQRSVARLVIGALRDAPLKSIGNGAFKYRYRLFPEEPNGSAFGLIFFDKVGFFGMTAQRDKPSGEPWRDFV